MKKALFLWLLIANVSYGQIFVQSGIDGSITITPNGLKGRNNNLTDSTNVSLGSSALALNYQMFFNTAIGGRSLTHNTTGGDNTAVGFNSLSMNTTANSNTAIGYAALAKNSTGNENTALGSSALLTNTTGRYNTSCGTGSLFYNSLGSNNTSLGYSAGHYNTIGDNNTYLGYRALGGNDYNNSMALGANAYVNSSNKVRIGDENVTAIEGAVPFSTPSDRRLKHNFAPSVLGLSFITRLTPMSYTYIADKTNVRRDGLIAQDVEKVMQELGVEFSGLQKSPGGTYSLAYSDFVMPLVNAAKELKQQNDEQQAKIERLEARLSALEELKAEITKLKADNTLRNSDKK